MSTTESTGTNPVDPPEAADRPSNGLAERSKSKGTERGELGGEKVSESDGGR